ncbi:MAG: PilZ domain-containing protein [Deltaproteobacteria bacterium]|nr:PilZ domain-containing protein [Deltaproteobacteria bacterium]
MSPAKETRLSPRTRIQAQIVFKILSGPNQDKIMTFTSENISEGGAFLKVTNPDMPFHVGDVLDMHFSLPNHPALIRAKGKVIWTTEGRTPDDELLHGFGVQFTDMKEDFRSVIRRFVIENCEI